MFLDQQCGRRECQSTRANNALAQQLGTLAFQFFLDMGISVWSDCNGVGSRVQPYVVADRPRGGQASWVGEQVAEFFQEVLHQCMGPCLDGMNCRRTGAIQTRPKNLAIVSSETQRLLGEVPEQGPKHT